MKELYFTAETLDNESAIMLEEIYSDAKTKQFETDLSNCALLVLDMQEYFLNPASHAFVPSSGPIIKGINELIFAFRKKNMPVIFTKHINTRESAGQMKFWWKDLVTVSNPLSCISPAIAVEGSTIIIKTQYDAFYDTMLEKMLKGMNCCRVVICGLMTHLCCESTARTAFIRGFEVIMPIDGTASYNKRFHLSSFYNLAHGFAVVTSIKELLNRFEEKQN